MQLPGNIPALGLLNLQQRAREGLQSLLRALCLLVQSGVLNSQRGTAPQALSERLVIAGVRIPWLNGCQANGADYPTLDAKWQNQYAVRADPVNKRQVFGRSDLPELLLIYNRDEQRLASL